MPRERKIGPHLKAGAVALRRYLDERSISVPSFCTSHGIDRIQVQRMLLGQRKRVSVEFAAHIDRATQGFVPMILWDQDAEQLQTGT